MQESRLLLHIPLCRVHTLRLCASGKRRRSVQSLPKSSHTRRRARQLVNLHTDTYACKLQCSKHCHCLEPGRHASSVNPAAALPGETPFPAHKHFGSAGPSEEIAETDLRVQPSAHKPVLSHSNNTPRRGELRRFCGHETH